MQHGVENTAKVVKHSKTVVKHSKTVVKHCKTLQKLFSGGPQMGPWWLLAGQGAGLPHKNLHVQKTCRKHQGTTETTEITKFAVPCYEITTSPAQEFPAPWGQGEL